MNRYFLVMLGAALGGLARYVAGSVLFARYSSRFPLGTILVNVTGCFLIGILMTVFTEREDPAPELRIFLVTGVLGGYTTFSSFAWESFAAIDKDEALLGLLNLVLSVVLGYLAVWSGALVGHAALGRAGK
jgi:fluoride exporter